MDDGRRMKPKGRQVPQNGQPQVEHRCPGCVALEKQIERLYDQLSEAQNRLLSVANPAGYQVYKGVPIQTVPMPGVGAEPMGQEMNGEAFVMVGGRKVPYKDYLVEMERLEEQMSGRAGTIPGNQGSEGTGGLEL